MSVVHYKIGPKEYSFESHIQTLCISPMAVEENLHEEVKRDIQKRNLKLAIPPRDIILCDDNGHIATIKDFQEIGNIQIKDL